MFKLVTSIGPSSINTCALAIFIQCTHAAQTHRHGNRFDNLIGLITHLIILSHVHPASDYSLAVTVWLCQWKMMETEWVLPAASRPVVFQGEHLNPVHTRHPGGLSGHLTSNRKPSALWEARPISHTPSQGRIVSNLKGSRGLPQGELGALRCLWVQFTPRKTSKALQNGSKWALI